jgi:hypothetical protein
VNEFTDNKGRKWRLTITAHSAKFLRERGLNLSWKDAVQSAAKDWTVITGFAAESPEQIVTLAAHLAAEQIRERGVSPEDFAAGFDGATLEAAYYALMHARANWVPGNELRVALRDILGGKPGGAEPEPPEPPDELAEAIDRGCN